MFLLKVGKIQTHLPHLTGKFLFIGEMKLPEIILVPFTGRRSGAVHTGCLVFTVFVIGVPLAAAVAILGIWLCTKVDKKSSKLLK